MLVRAVLLFMALCLSGCATTGAPDVKPNAERNLQLVVTDLVTALIQIRKLNPTVTTLQFSQPQTDLGKKLLAALENAGYGIQMVETDQGQNYVSYAVRTAETEAGIVNDYLIKIDDVELRREYNTTQDGIFPSSLLFLKGVTNNADIVLNEQIFAEQGGGELFLSGVDPGRSGVLVPSAIKEVYTDENLRINAHNRVAQQVVFSEARKKSFDVEKKYELESMSGLQPFQRLVVLFENNTTLTLGVGNKTAIKIMLEKYEDGDIFRIAACDDIDGRNEMAERRAIRVKEEFMGHGVPARSVSRAPCTRTNFRHHSDDSPTPVSIVQYRTPRVSLN